MSREPLKFINTYGCVKGSILAIKRILRCNPLTKRRIDPVPLNKEEKRKLKLINNLKTNFDMVYIDTILKYPSLSKEDYKQLKDIYYGE